MFIFLGGADEGIFLNNAGGFILKDLQNLQKPLQIRKKENEDPLEKALRKQNKVLWNIKDKLKAEITTSSIVAGNLSVINSDTAKELQKF